MCNVGEGVVCVDEFGCFLVCWIFGEVKYCVVYFIGSNLCDCFEVVLCYWV